MTAMQINQLKTFTADVCPTLILSNHRIPSMSLNFLHTHFVTNDNTIQLQYSHLAANYTYDLPLQLSSYFHLMTNKYKQIQARILHANMLHFNVLHRNRQLCA